MKWEEVKAEFEWDGSWRDLYVLGTTVDDWRRLLDFVRGEYPVLFQYGAEDHPLPDDPGGFFVGESEQSSLLSIDVGGIIINAHFFEADQIELDIDPREVQSEERVASLFEFMRGVGQALGKPVRLTPENRSQHIIFEYDPAQDEVGRGRE